jgi:predicted acyl esterase
MRMKKVITATVLLILFAPITGGLAEPDNGKKFPAPFTVKIPMRDGKKLAADVFLPSGKEGEGKFPTILIMTPYNRKLLAAAIPAAAMKSKLIDREHYAFVIVDWRGFYGSKDAGGEPGKAQSDLRGKDGYDTVEWIAKQKWSDGKVGMWGSSALGKIQYWTAIQQPPHLVCICPMVCQHGYFHNRYYHGGVYRKCNNDILEQVGFTGATKGIRKYPTYSNLWKYAESPAVNKYSKLNIPILIIGGWYDTHTEGVLQTFGAIRRHAGPEAKKNIKMLVGPWEHCFAHAGPLKVGELEFPEAKAVSEKEAGLPRTSRELLIICRRMAGFPRRNLEKMPSLTLSGTTRTTLRPQPGE